MGTLVIHNRYAIKKSPRYGEIYFLIKLSQTLNVVEMHNIGL